MPTHVGSSREQHCNRNSPPDSTFGYQLDSALESRHCLSQKAQLLSISERKGRQKLCKAAFNSFASALLICIRMRTVGTDWEQKEIFY